MDLKEMECEDVEWIYLTDVMSSCEHNNEPSSFIKFVNCVRELLLAYQQGLSYGVS